MRLLSLALLLAVASVIPLGSSQPNTPESYNAAGSHQISTDPCADINVQGWVDVPASRVTMDPNFDDAIPADYASIWTGQDNLYKFPNGFRKGQVFENNDPPFCINVYGVANKQVQVMLQTVDELARLCIKDSTTSTVRSGGTINRCFTEKHTACFSQTTYSNKLTLVLYTDSAGASTATPFWYRIRTSAATWSLDNEADKANSAIGSLEMWCAMQEQNTENMKFPKDLRSVVTPEIAAFVVAGDSSSSPTQHSISIVAIVALTLAALVAIMRQ